MLFQILLPITEQIQVPCRCDNQGNWRRASGHTLPPRVCRIRRRCWNYQRSGSDARRLRSPPTLKFYRAVCLFALLGTSQLQTGRQSVTGRQQAADFARAAKRVVMETSAAGPCVFGRRAFAGLCSRRSDCRLLSHIDARIDPAD